VAPGLRDPRRRVHRVAEVALEAAELAHDERAQMQTGAEVRCHAISLQDIGPPAAIASWHAATGMPAIGASRPTSSFARAGTAIKRGEVARSSPVMAPHSSAATMVGVQLDLFDDIEVLDRGVEVAKRCSRSCIDDGPRQIFAREGFDGLHGLPVGQHDKLDLIIDQTTAG
jgi:hypothetical protein